jgi:membrane protease YdiL (CAAX protease family)
MSDKQIILQKVSHFFLTKMIAGIAVIVALVALVESLRSFILDKTNLSNDTKALTTSITEALIAVAGYIVLFKIYDKREIHELDRAQFIGNATTGFATGILLQTLFILVIYMAGTYAVVHVNPASALIAPFAFALTAGFVAEIIMIGIVFRLLEEQTGTIIALIIFITLFAILHVNIKGASVVSVGATALQAGFLLPASYVFRRSLWVPVFLHFGWDFAEPGIFGGINPSSSLTRGLLTSNIAGNSLLTGAETGPQDSLTSLLLCLITGIIFLFLAKRKNNFIKPRWVTNATNRIAVGESDTAQHTRQ